MDTFNPIDTEETKGKKGKKVSLTTRRTPVGIVNDG